CVGKRDEGVRKRRVLLRRKFRKSLGSRDDLVDEFPRLGHLARTDRELIKRRKIVVEGQERARRREIGIARDRFLQQFGRLREGLLPARADQGLGAEVSFIGVHVGGAALDQRFAA